MVLVRNAAAGRGLLYTSASFSSQSDFVSRKSCICVTLMSQNPPVLLPRKSVCRHTLPHRRVRRQPLFRVSRKQRYNTLDFAEQNRVPTGMLRAPIGNPAAKRCSLCNPSFSSQVHIQTAKMQLAMPAQKMQKEACASAWHRLPFGWERRRRERQFLLHSHSPPPRGRAITNGENLNISGRFIAVNTRRLDVLRQAFLRSSVIFPPFHPSRIPTLLPTSSVTMYNPVPIFLTDPAWQSRISPTVPMLSVTGRPRGFSWCGGSPWE